VVQGGARSCKMVHERVCFQPMDSACAPYRTLTPRPAALQVGKLDWAMASLKQAMKWDEETFGLEYDLEARPAPRLRAEGGAGCGSHSCENHEDMGTTRM
jgi:hypothetical protein